VTSNEQPLKIGTRGSQLALYQANTVAALLRARAHVECEIVVIRTSGDQLAEARLAQIGGKRLFVKEIEDALLAGDVDLAVHSSKDMPALLPPGLAVAAVLPREDARDAVVLPAAGDGTETGLSLEGIVARLGRAPRIGTSSVRRAAQLTRLFPGGSFLPIRGNLDTRLRKVDAGEFDAIVLAAAGLRRLEQQHRISSALPVDACVPAPGQGIIAIEIRSADQRLRDLLAVINDGAAGVALEAERAVTGDTLTLTALVVSLDGSRALRTEASGDVVGANAVGHAAAEQLLAQGAGEILAEVERAQGTVEGLQP
jgi:hydroxymethylbilane synthase